MRIARKHLGWYAKGLNGAAEFRARMNREEDPAQVTAMIHALFAQVLERPGFTGTSREGASEMAAA